MKHLIILLLLKTLLIIISKNYVIFVRVNIFNVNLKKNLNRAKSVSYSALIAVC